MRSYVFFLGLVAFLLVCTMSYASAPPPPDPDQIPLDPLSWVLLASGGAVAGKKYYDYRKSKKSNNTEA